MIMNESNRVVWITGGTRGVGQATANVLGSTYNLALSYRADDRSAETLKEHLQKDTGREILLLRGDLSKEGVADGQVAAIVEHFGHLDDLVHCVAITTFKPALALQSRELRQTLAFSFESFHKVVKAAEKYITQSCGSIVAVSSMGSRRAIPRYAGLGAAKAALESFARYLALEMGPKGVRVNVVSPGLLHSANLSLLGIGKAELAEIESRTPLARLVTQEEVAQTISFLISSAASGITGQVIIVDGGYEIYA
jgi:enoyl-[acyl-carrier protein] reductase III